MNNSLRDEVVLLPCPFCGGDASLNNSQVDEDSNEYWVRCDGCGAVVSNSENGCHADEEAAIAAWNRRHPPADGVSVPRDLLRRLSRTAEKFATQTNWIGWKDEALRDVKQADAILSEGKA